MFYAMFISFSVMVGQYYIYFSNKHAFSVVEMCNERIIAAHVFYTVSNLMKATMFEATCTVVPALLPDAKPGFKLSVILKGGNIHIENILCHYMEGY